MGKLFISRKETTENVEGSLQSLGLQAENLSGMIYFVAALLESSADEGYIISMHL